MVRELNFKAVLALHNQQPLKKANDMFDKKTMISKEDVSSGNVIRLAEHIKDNWPSSTKISLEEAKEVLASSLGHDNYEGLISSATDIPSKSVPDSITAYYNISKKYKNLISELGISPKDIYNGCNTELAEIIGKWPYDTLGRWGSDKSSCCLDGVDLSIIDEYFDEIFINNDKNHYPMLTTVESTNSVANIISSFHKNISHADLENKKIGDLIDGEIAEALVNDCAPKVIQKLLEINTSEIMKASGIGSRELQKLPESELSFPMLYAHLRSRAATLLGQDALSVFTIKKRQDGFYFEPMFRAFQDSHREILENCGIEFIFNCHSDQISNETFKSYTWDGHLQDINGNLLCYAFGTYFAGPATKNSSGFALIDAADETNDSDVAIIDSVLDILQMQVEEEYGEDIEKGDLNLRTIFASGNLVTIIAVERNSSADKGLGITLIDKCLSKLKARYKRNMHVAALIYPFQYKDDSLMLESLSDEFHNDFEKIGSHFMNISYHPNVECVFLTKEEPRTGFGAMVPYYIHALN
ncbi:hypothetical protein ACYPKM_04550 [Pseudomonas aeruginosa]